MPSSSNYRLSSILSPIKSGPNNNFRDSYSKISGTNSKLNQKYNDYYFDNSNCVNINIKDETQPGEIKSLSQIELIIYDKNLFRFKIFVVILLYISRSIIETRHIVSNIDEKTLITLKIFYNIIFFSCIFAFTYISGKSFTTSILTLNKTIELNHSNNHPFNQKSSRIIRIFTHPNFLSIKTVIYKSITKYFIPGFLILYFIQPFSYYISSEYPIWAERITLSPINFFLDSLDRIIYKASLDTASKKISYFPQVLIYLSFIRIICFPITELTKYIIECSLGEIRNSILQNCSRNNSNDIDLMEACNYFPTTDTNTNNTTTNTIGSVLFSKYSTILDMNNSNNVRKYQENLNSPLLTNELEHRDIGVINVKNQAEYYFYEREFSFISLISKATIPILVILMLYYYKLGEFSMLIFIPLALPIITFSLAGHLSSVTKVQISLALTYILLFFLLIPLKDYSIIWKLCLIFLLGATDSQLSFMRSQYNNYLKKREEIYIIHPLLKSISLLVLFLTIVYITFFFTENKYFQNLTIYLNTFKEISLLFLMITITSHPLFRSELYLVKSSNGIEKIKKENQNLFIMIFLHPITIRIVSFLLESKIKLELPIYINILFITITSLLLTQIFHYIILVFSSFGSFLKSYIQLKIKNKN
ncbi:Uncharacterized protein CTYZ_00000483 [Cryptosporidium tyzzeri]|nr:Uncharacterized protein CTYZ_00000483 [Cryptosporidium tyzzeri]